MTVTLTFQRKDMMIDMEMLIQQTVRRIAFGEATPVKKEFKKRIASELDTQQIPYTVRPDEQSHRVLFKRKRVRE
jgi:hypothetical protein